MDNVKEKADAALKCLQKNEDELWKIKIDSYDTFKDRLERWKERLVLDLKTYVSERESKVLENAKYVQKYAISSDYTRQQLMMDTADFYRGKIEVLREELENHPESILDPNIAVHKGDWEIFLQLMNPKVQTLARSRFNTSHYADAVEACFKELNNEVKALYKSAGKGDKDGRDLMINAIALENPVLKFTEDLTTQDGISTQEGYRFIFAGAMSAIRNPKAHGNLKISPEEGIHLLFLASHLFNKLDKRIMP